MTDDTKEVTYRVEFETGDVMHTTDRDLAILHREKGRLVTPDPHEQSEHHSTKEKE
ncbi:hypothetical protein SAMN05216466_10760 [Paraburkholderia phenazinium]|uniref:Uncharacterized protein n=1 Tax=Paraburkholderia phenazinium TaxID=60549 RepID=A0A1G7ZLH4_9BURK|nr:hypothetical protein [Paraburkholderia phenazinium]SDH08950.1 hypothetical protein SAMN05216466_10760 [Paraburkholderia phenazinium]